MRTTVFLSTVLFVLLISLGAVSVRCQEIYEYYPEDASILPIEIRSLTNSIVQLHPGVYDMDFQLRFNADSNLIIEGSGSGLGEDATILDFTIYSETAEEGDSRALSVRGGVVMRNLTIRNVGNRAADLRTGTIDAPSDASVLFDHVWFVDCVTGLKSTGGRIVGSESSPMVVNYCVFLNTPDFPFPDQDSFLDFRDTTNVIIEHCDFFNTDDIIQMTVDDPEAAPNDGPKVLIQNSILYSTNGAEDDDLYVQDGRLILQNCLLWDSGSQGGLDRLGEGTIEEVNTRIGDPLYIRVTPDTPGAELDFHLQAGSPAKGLALFGWDAGSKATMPVSIEDWGLYE